MALNWGILGTGVISHDFYSGFTTLQPEEHKLIAVAGRRLESAEKFAVEHSIEKAYGSYEELLQDAKIDIVYIGTISSTHYPWAKKCLEAGKHVLCEKPLCVNVKETKELVDYAKKKKLFLMEAIWSRHFPSYHQLRKELTQKSIGDIQHVLVTFGIMSSPQGYRLKPRVSGAGTMLDIGVYCVQLVNLIYGNEKPEKILAGGRTNDDGVDASTSSSIYYFGGRSATIITHSDVDLPNEAIISGTKGAIKVPFPFWCANKLETPNESFEFHLPVATVKPILLHSEGLSYQCVEARRCILKGLIESPFMSHEESIRIAEIMEDIRKQVGVIYPADEHITKEALEKYYGTSVPQD